MEDQELDKQKSSAAPAMPDAGQTPAGPNRASRFPYRMHYAVLATVYFVALILALVALGSFGVKEAEVHSFVRDHNLRQGHNCILYAKPIDEYNERRILLSTAGPCNFVLWGEVSVLIVVVVWFIYNIVLMALGPKM